MPVQTSYPGVYVQEVPSGVRTITGVSTSIAVFIGRTKMGPINEPVLCLSYSDFVRTFSGDYAGGELASSVKLFFLNGGIQCYVTRIANGAVASSITLRDVATAGIDVLTFTAKSAGVIGDSIRIRVTYNGVQPESTFNVELFRWVTNSVGQTVKADPENWQGLSMDPSHPKYAPLFLTQNSMLVNVEDKFTLPPPALLPALNLAYSQSGRALANTSAAVFRTALGSALTATSYSFFISVNGAGPKKVDLSSLVPLSGTTAAIIGLIQGAINSVLPATTPVEVSLQVPPSAPAGTGYIRVSSPTAAGAARYDVYIQPASADDVARALMLGTAQGGIEVSRYSDARPAPNDMFFKLSDFVTFGDLAQTAFDTITINGKDISLIAPYALTTAAAGSFMYQDGFASSINGNSDGIREKLSIIADAINNERANNPLFKWSAQVWGSRLAIISGEGGDNSTGTVTTKILAGGGTDIGPNIEQRNIRYYSLGITSIGPFRIPGFAGVDGSAPALPDYAQAYTILDKEVDLFNLMILPHDSGHTAATTASLWGPASVFCDERRAFLIMDSPDSWKTVQQATNPTSGVNSLRIGLVKDHSAIFFPRITIKENGLDLQVGASGAIAGLMARIDGSRGVWKASAGTEADIRGITGVEYRFSDRENGQLNPQAINTIRIFPNGIVNWGARTMDGDDDFASEYKYIPIRRTALYIEESLYRGLKWVVFEPNDEPLWSQIRLNVGAFMHNLFRQGAFQGTTKQDAYFVKCDAETTTKNDRNLGIVNIWVGFAPLKPAEFVILYLQQIAGQIQV